MNSDTPLFSLERKSTFAIFLLSVAAFLLLYAPILGISESEAKIFFGDKGLLGYILRTSAGVFGQNNFAIRSPFIFLHIINAALIYKVSRDFSRGSDAFLSAALYALLPGVNSAAMLASNAQFIILASLVFIILYARAKFAAIAMLFALSLLSNLFIALVLSAAIREIYYKNYRMVSPLLLFALLSYSLYDIEIGGLPRGYFLDIFGLYGVIFSPFIFFYFIYSAYWFIFKSESPPPMLWFVCVCPFLISIILSMRQNMPIENYASFTVISTPLMIAAFMSSWRARLPRFRKTYLAGAAVCVFSLLLIDGLTFFNKPLYLLLNDPGAHFAKRHHFAEDLADRLKARGIAEVECGKRNLCLRLKYYGIKGGKGWKITEEPIAPNSEPIIFTAFGRQIAVFYLTQNLAL